MFEIYTYEAIYALNEAQKVAQQMGSLSVEPEHILLGLRKEGVGSAARFLRQKKISFEDLKKLLDLDSNPDLNERKIGFSANSKEILDSLYNEAKESNCSLIGQKELFLKLVENSKSVGVKLKELNATPTEDELEHLDSKEYGNTLDIPPAKPVVLQNLQALNLTEIWCLHSFFIQTGSLREISIKGLDATLKESLIDFIRQRIVVLGDLIVRREEGDTQPIRVKLGPADLNGWSWDEDEIIFDLMPADLIDTRLKIAALSFMAEISQFLNMPISMADESLKAEPMIVMHSDGTMDIYQQRELQEQSN
ncbi:MAG: hypothetical protein K2X81_27080 [Candidatus Obscuribacterales bacterium]|nr:hypothetical protein [Candidatus Obscuribacterales bacterium]